MKTIVFKGSSFVVLDVSKDLPQQENFPFGSVWNPKVGEFVCGTSAYREVKRRRIKKVWVHHTAGGIKRRGFQAPLATASFVISDPRVVNGQVSTAYGRGWPGMPYHAFVPFSPVLDDREKLPTIYQTAHPDWITWHTNGANKDGYGIVCQGNFTLEPGTPGQPHQPSVQQFELLQAAWEEWLKPQFKLSDADLYGHADATKPTCPGGTIYDWILGVREKRTIRKVEAGEVKP